MSFSTAPDNPKRIDHEILLRRVIHRIRRSLELQVILDTSASEIQQFLDVDRVMIYRFHPDQSGQVIAEHCAPGGSLPSLLGLNFPADDIPQETRQLFVEARVRNIVDVESGIIGQSRLRDPETGQPLTEDWVFRPLDPCHAEYLTAMGVKSSVVSPVFHGEYLWGLLVAHHSLPRELSIQKLEAVQLIVGQLSTAIAQAALLTEAQARAQRESTISRITTLLHSFTTIRLESALTETVTALQGVGGRLFIPDPESEAGGNQPITGVVHTTGTQPKMHGLGQQRPLEYFHSVQAYWQATDYASWAVEDIFAISSLRNLQLSFQQAGLRSWLVVPLMARQRVVAYLSIFRPERETETLWAGHFDPDVRQAFPRQSFEIWRQTEQGQVYPWTPDDIDLATTLGAQFAIAIEQHTLYQRITTLNNTLEHQVKARTADLQKTLEELQRTQTQLIHTEKMSSLGQLVAGIAHEINNPVNFIHGNLSHLRSHAINMLELLLLYQHHFPDADTEILEKSDALDLDFVSRDFPKILASMEVGTSRIREIIQSLRNFSRLDQAEMKPVDIHEGIDSTLMILQHRLKQISDDQNIQVVKTYGDLPQIECLASQLNQVFMNILSNAIDALEGVQDRLRTISICTQRVGDDQVAIQISDNGKGIPKEARNRLFDPFFTTKPVGKGTGLGLSISHEIIVNKHGGKLECTSTSDQGATFTITIPLQPVGAGCS
jgi:light-regulated signal transduction histidine kinase (bacteriophytochrome)